MPVLDKYCQWKQWDFYRVADSQIKVNMNKYAKWSNAELKCKAINSVKDSFSLTLPNLLWYIYKIYMIIFHFAVIFSDWRLLTLP